MAEGGRWFRVNTTWSQSEWLAALRPASRLAWIELLAHVKAHGYDGRVRSVAPAVFGRMVGISTGDVSALLKAAIADGALEEVDGHWIITGWKGHQGDPTAASRMRRLRGVTDVTRNDRNVTPTETETETSTKTERKTDRRASKRWRFVPDDWQPTARHEQLAAELHVDVGAQEALFRDHEFKDPKTDANRAFSRWLRNAPTMTRRNGMSADEKLIRHRQQIDGISLNDSRSIFE